jgi:hypothetical protein
MEARRREGWVAKPAGPGNRLGRKQQPPKNSVIPGRLIGMSTQEMRWRQEMAQRFGD